MGQDHDVIDDLLALWLTFRTTISVAVAAASDRAQVHANHLNHGRLGVGSAATCHIRCCHKAAGSQPTKKAHPWGFHGSSTAKQCEPHRIAVPYLRMEQKRAWAIVSGGQRRGLGGAQGASPWSRGLPRGRSCQRRRLGRCLGGSTPGRADGVAGGVRYPAKKARFSLVPPPGSSQNRGA